MQLWFSLESLKYDKGHFMKKTAILSLLSFVFVMTQAQEIEKELKSFNRIIASPRINVILQKGDNERIRLVYTDVSKNKINVAVRSRTLHIYLDDARKVEPTVRSGRYGERRSFYEGVSVTAYVTYTTLEALEIRGNQELTCMDPLSSEKFVLRAYGENEITLASLKTDFFKASLYGENKLVVKGGRVVEQRYRLFGENKIDTRELRSAFTSTSIFGEGNLKINSSEEVVVDAFGEPEIDVNGGASVNRRLVFGRASISSR